MDASAEECGDQLQALLDLLGKRSPEKVEALKVRLPRLSVREREALLKKLRNGLGQNGRAQKIRPRTVVPAEPPDAEDWSERQVTEQLDRILAKSATPRLAALREQLPALTLDRKRALLRRLLEYSLKDVTQARLSYAQQRSWFFEALSPNSGAQNIAAAVRAQGPLNLAILERALNEVIKRHEVLRTNFRAVRGKPVQLIHPARRIRIAERMLPGASIEQGIEAVLADARPPFDLSTDPLIRLTSLKIGSEDCILLLVMHHIVGDEWSIGLLLEELGVLYAHDGNPRNLPELPVQYADYAEWEAEALTAATLRHEIEYWSKKLAGSNMVLEVPTDRRRPALQTTNGAMETLSLSAEVFTGITAIARAEKATMFMALLAAFNVLLHARTGAADILVGTDFASRNRHETARLIGFFVNELVLRTGLGANPTFLELVRQVRQTSLECYDHQSLPFQWLVEELRLPRDRSRTPVFQVLFDLHNIPMLLEFRGVSFSPVHLPVRPAKYDLTLFISESPRDLHALLEYNTDLYDRKTAQGLLRDYQEILLRVAANPNLRVSELAAPIRNAREKSA